MVGIVSYGAYVPMWRMERALIANEAGGGSMGGERAVASWDEDSLTMAVEAGLDCLSGCDPKAIGGLYFATVSPPYKQKQASSIIASALDLREDIYTFDFTSSTRAGTAAVKAALDSIGAGSAERILVISADCRNGRPRSEHEQIYGAGAAALLIGKDDVIAEIRGFATRSNPIPGSWQRMEDDYVKTFEPKLDRRYGIVKDVPAVVNRLLQEHTMTQDDISKFALYAPEPRTYRDLAKALGIDPKSQIQDPLFSSIGITGTPHALILLIAALESAKPGKNMVCSGYGEGADAFLVAVTEKIASIEGKHRGTKYIASKRMIPSYGCFMDFQKTRDIGWPRKDLKTSVVKYWRDEKWELPLYGMRCNQCNTLQYPIARCCMMCGEKDNHEEVKLAHKGEIFTYTHDYIYGPGLVPVEGVRPATRIVADMEDGCRLWLVMTDYEIEEVAIGMPIETTFRLIHEKGDYRYYSWRARPLRG